MIERKLGYNNEEMLEYLQRLKRVQKNYIDRVFVTRIKMSTKRSHQRDISHKSRISEDAYILEKINKSIAKYSENTAICQIQKT